MTIERSCNADDIAIMSVKEAQTVMRLVTYSVVGLERLKAVVAQTAVDIERVRSNFVSGCRNNVMTSKSDESEAACSKLVQSGRMLTTMQLRMESSSSIDDDLCEAC